MLHQGKARDYVGLMGRFILLAIPLIIAVRLPSINFAATVAGIFSVKAAIFYHFLISNRRVSIDTENSRQKAT